MVPDPSGTAAILAVDTDMQGGAHNDHGPLLTGLTPDTEYKYILRGSDAAAPSTALRR